MTTMQNHADGRHDFDFLVGEWHVHHRKLADMTDPDCTDWVEFDGVQWMRQTLGGLGNVDNLRIDKAPNGEAYEGMSVRLYNVETGEWTIWWASTAAPGHLDPGVTGRWQGTHGVFNGDDVVGGNPVRVRFEWDVVTDDSADGASAAADGVDYRPDLVNSAQWQQAFSFDDGATWVHNWRMTFTRISG